MKNSIGLHLIIAIIISAFFCFIIPFNYFTKSINLNNDLRKNFEMDNFTEAFKTITESQLRSVEVSIKTALHSIHPDEDNYKVITALLENDLIFGAKLNLLSQNKRIVSYFYKREFDEIVFSKNDFSNGAPYDFTSYEERFYINFELFEGNQHIISLAYPILKDGEFYGYLSAYITLDSLIDVLNVKQSNNQLIEIIPNLQIATVIRPKFSRAIYKAEDGKVLLLNVKLIDDSNTDEVLNETVSIFILCFVLLSIWLVLFIFFRVLRPVDKIIDITRNVSAGNFDIDIEMSYEKGGRINALFNSLIQVIEQFRMYILMQEKTQEQMIAYSFVMQLTQKPPDNSSILNDMSRLLCTQFKMNRCSIVFLRDEMPFLLSCYDSGTEYTDIDFTTPPQFLFHEQVNKLLLDKDILFFNQFAINLHNLAFLDSDTFCTFILPLRIDSILSGYVILENKCGNRPISNYDESALVDISKMLAIWLSKPAYKEIEHLEAIEKNIVDTCVKQDTAENLTSSSLSSNNELQDEQEDVQEALFKSEIIARAAEIVGLNVEYALNNMGGLEDLYERSLELFLELTPSLMQSINEEFKNREIELFAINVHGIKGSLNNIGALSLGNMAAQLERSAKEGLFDASYERFMTNLIEFVEILKSVLNVSKSKQQGVLDSLGASLPKIREALSEYDIMMAQEMLEQFKDLTFGADIDTKLSAIKSAVIAFDCDTALSEATELEEVINNTV